MNLNNRLKQLKHQPGLPPREEALAQTIAQCRKLCLRQGQDRLLSYGEFLWTQLQYTRKRWWALQGALLLLAAAVIPTLEGGLPQVRTLGIIGCLFVVLMIPELWRNRENNSLPVEAACLYSLRQIYAARITLFGLVDVGLITLFGLTLGRMGFTLTEVTAQFLLPVTVTASICFLLLCGGGRRSTAGSMAVCLVWGGIWWLIQLKEWLWLRILPPVWGGLFALSLALLILAVRRTLGQVNQFWEVELS